MKITQLYETTIVDRDGGLEARFIVLPRRAFASQDALPTPRGGNVKSEKLQFIDIVEQLSGVDPHFIDAERLVDAVAVCLSASTPEIMKRFSEIMHSREVIEPPLYAHQIEFAKILAFAPVVPFENSPLHLDSVATLITGASGVGLGAYAGFVVAGSSPLIFVTVPMGMIIFGAAAGVANALEQGLRTRLLKVIKGK